VQLVSRPGATRGQSAGRGAGALGDPGRREIRIGSGDATIYLSNHYLSVAFPYGAGESQGSYNSTRQLNDEDGRPAQSKPVIFLGGETGNEEAISQGCNLLGWVIFVGLGIQFFMWRVFVRFFFFIGLSSNSP